MWLVALNDINLSVKEQREELLKLNPDLLAGVYCILYKIVEELNLELVDNVLTCYPNQLDNLKWLDDNLDITIINLSELRK